MSKHKPSLTSVVVLISLVTGHLLFTYLHPGEAQAGITGLLILSSIIAIKRKYYSTQKDNDEMVSKAEWHDPK